MTAALHKDGYETATPALDLDSLAGDVSIVQATLDSIGGDKILVGHSYGGFVISNAAVNYVTVVVLRGLESLTSALSVKHTRTSAEPDVRSRMSAGRPRRCPARQSLTLTAA